MSLISQQITTDPNPFKTLLLYLLNTPASQKIRFKHTEQEINAFTKTKQCWAAVLQILHEASDNSSLADYTDQKQLEFLASNILKDKFKYDFGQLGTEFTGVHTSLLGLLQKFTVKLYYFNNHNNNNCLLCANIQKPETPVRNNLSLCVVYTYMHKYAELGDLLEYLKTHLCKTELIPYVFTILMMLPQEIEDFKVVIQEEKRIQLLRYMREHIQRQVLIQLNTAANAYWDQKLVRKTTFLRCFAKWIELKPDQEVLSSLPGHFVLNAAISNMGDSDISEQCVNVVVTAIRRLGEPQSTQNMIAACKVVRQMIQAEAIEEFVEPFVKVICEFARCSIPEFLVAPTEESNNFLKDLVVISSERNTEYVEETANFWIDFCARIVSQRSEFAGGYYEGLLKTLLMSCCQVIQLTPAQALDTNTMTNKEIENRRANYELKMKLRSKFQELFDLIGQIVGYTNCVELILTTIDVLDNQTKDYWCRLESLMIPLTNLVEFMNEIEGAHSPPEFLNEKVRKFINLEPPFRCLDRAILSFLAECSELYEQTRQDLIMEIFKYTNDKLQEPMLYDLASSTFEKICKHNPTFVHTHINIFIELFLQNQTNQKILLGILHAISGNQLQLLNYLPMLFQPHVDTITTLLERESRSHSQTKDIKLSLERLTLIISTLIKDGSFAYCQLPINAIFRGVWPSLRPQITNPDQSNHYDFLERICKFLKNTMRCLQKAFWTFMQDVFSTILQAYEHYPVGSYVYTVEVAVTVFYKYPEYQKSLEIIFEKTCDVTFKHLQKLKNFEDNPDLGNDFFGMCVRFLRYNQETILKCSRLEGILNLAIIACGIDNKNIARPLYAFLQRLYMLYWDQSLIDAYNSGDGADIELKIVNPPETWHLVQALQHKLTSSAGVIIERMLNHLELGPISAVREYICDTLKAEIKAFPQVNQSIWMPVLGKLNEDILTEVQKMNILNALPYVLEKQSRELLEEMVYRMSRRFLNSKMRAPVS